MRRASLLILLLLAAALAWAEGYPQIAASIEYRHDVVDYDAPAADFYRTSFRLNLSGRSSCGTASVFTDGGREIRSTWNISLLDLAPSAWFIAGHYYAHFGYGLLMGRRMRASPDEFRFASGLSDGTSFAGCGSGNPVYAFHGIAMGYALQCRGWSVSVNPFYSMRERYAHRDADTELLSESSLSTLSMRLDHRYPYTVPVSIIDAGIMTEVKGGDRFIFQGYMFNTELLRGGQERLRWDYDGTQYLAGSIRRMYAYGLYARYRDEYASIFVEAGLPCREMELVDGSIKAIRDYGVVYGLHIRHRVASFLFRGKETGPRFYAQYGRSGSYPEREWYGAVKIAPLERLTIGSAFSFEKGLAPSREDYAPVTLREQVHAKYLSGRGRITLRITRVFRDREHRGGGSLQGRSNIRLRITDCCKMGATALLQRSRGKRGSASFGTDMTVTFLRHLSASAYYSCFLVSSGERVYRNPSPWRGSVASGYSVSETSHIAGCGFVFIHGRTRAWLGYSHQFSRGRSVSWRVEAFGSAVL